MVSNLDDIEIVFNDNYRVACIDQLLQHIDQAVYIRDMQARRRLIENIHRASSGALGKLSR